MIARLWLMCFLILGVLVLAPPVSADRIITIHEVTNRVKVRHRPGIDSPSIGSLRYNESAEMLESLSYWYHIKLDNGVPGYISRAWTLRMSEAEGDGEIIRLGFWKIKGLGQDISADYKAIARAIESNFDLLAIAGIREGEDGRPGYAGLLRALGSGWAALFAEPPRPESAGSGAEFYAILYRSAIVRPCTGWKSLVYYDQGEGGEAGSDSDQPSRGPAFGCFEAPMNKSSMGIDFMLGVYQALEADASGGATANRVDRIDEALAAAQAARPRERDIIIAGTFNLSGPELQDSVEARVRTKGSGSVLNQDGELTGDLYDHMLIADNYAASEMIDAPQVIDVRGVAASNQEFYQTCSDHLPILMRLRTTGPDDD